MLLKSIAMKLAGIDRVAEDCAKYSGAYFFIVGVKTFLDGVIEANTGWMLEYFNQRDAFYLECIKDAEKIIGAPVWKAGKL